MPTGSLGWLDRMCASDDCVTQAILNLDLHGDRGRHLAAPNGETRRAGADCAAGTSCKKCANIARVEAWVAMRAALSPDGAAVRG